MAIGRKTGGRQKGTLNRRTQARLDYHGRLPGGSFRALERMISMAKWFETQAAKEQNKGDTADVEKIERLLFKAHLMCAKIAEYQDPKLSSVRVSGEDGGAIKHEHEHNHAAAFEHVTSAIARLAARSEEDGDPSKLN